MGQGHNWPSSWNQTQQGGHKGISVFPGSSFIMHRLRLAAIQVEGLDLPIAIPRSKWFLSRFSFATFAYAGFLSCRRWSDENCAKRDSGQSDPQRLLESHDAHFFVSFR